MLLTVPKERYSLVLYHLLGSSIATSSDRLRPIDASLCRHSASAATHGARRITSVLPSQHAESCEVALLAGEDVLRSRTRRRLFHPRRYAAHTDNYER